MDICAALPGIAPWDVGRLTVGQFYSAMAHVDDLRRQASERQG